MSSEVVPPSLGWSQTPGLLEKRPFKFHYSEFIVTNTLVQTVDTSRPHSLRSFCTHLIGRFPAEPPVKLIPWLRSSARIPNEEAMKTVKA